MVPSAVRKRREAIKNTSEEKGVEKKNLLLLIKKGGGLSMPWDVGWGNVMGGHQTDCRPFSTRKDCVELWSL